MPGDLKMVSITLPRSSSVPLCNKRMGLPLALEWWGTGMLHSGCYMNMCLLQPFSFSLAFCYTAETEALSTYCISHPPAKLHALWGRILYPIQFLQHIQYQQLWSRNWMKAPWFTLYSSHLFLHPVCIFLPTFITQWSFPREKRRFLPWLNHLF